MTRVGVSRADPEGLKGEGEELVRQAREDGGIEDEDFGILFSATSFNFRSLMEGLDQEIESDWIGGTTVGEIHPEGPGDGTAVLMLIETDEIQFEAVRSKEITGNAEEAAASAVRRINTVADPEKNELVFTLIPGFTLEKDGREFKFLKGLERELERDIDIVGGSTGDGHRLKENYQFKNGEIYADRAVMVMVKTDLNIKTGQAHGFDQDVATGVVNETDGRLLKRVNGKPALDWYAEETGLEKGELSKIYEAKLKERLGAGLYYLGLKLRGKDPSMVHRILEHSLDYSLATEMRPRDYRVISPLAVEGDAIKLLGDVKEDQNIKILEGATESVLEAPETAFSDVGSEKTVLGVLADCANRHDLLDEEEREREVNSAVEALGDRIIGFYGEGEIGSGSGLCTYMNQTITGFAIERHE